MLIGKPIYAKQDVAEIIIILITQHMRQICQGWEEDVLLR
jgi:hypothetical protein